MAASLATLWIHLGEHAVIPALVALAVGGILTALKPWIPGEEDVRRRVDFQRHALRERTATELTRMLDVARTEGATLRGAPPQEDYPGNFARVVFRCFQSYLDLVHLHASVKGSHSILMWSTIAALLAAMGAFLIVEARPYIAVLCYVLIATEICAVLRLRLLAKQLEKFEHDD